MIIDKSNFLKRSTQALGELFDSISNLPGLRLEELRHEQTALVIVDMINGFTREGALKSQRIEELVPKIKKLSELCGKAGITKLAFADSHNENSPEFDAYPVHCLAGSYQEQVVEEIREEGGYTLIPKNSTNGFLEEKFQKWLGENQHIDTFIITGDCTDICIQQFAITLKTWFNMHNKRVRVIVPENAVETYDLGLHSADLMNVMALYNMMGNGIEVVREIVI